jgi:hypothetical protein
MPAQAYSCSLPNRTVYVETSGTVSTTSTCLAPFDLDVVTLSSHAHQDLVKFETRMYDGTLTLPAVLYTTDWESPVVAHPATTIHLKAGQGVTFTCHFANATTSPIGFGLTATSEMCAAMASYAHPATQTGTQIAVALVPLWSPNPRRAPTRCSPSCNAPRNTSLARARDIPSGYRGQSMTESDLSATRVQPQRRLVTGFISPHEYSVYE